MEWEDRGITEWSSLGSSKDVQGTTESDIQKGLESEVVVQNIGGITEYELRRSEATGDGWPEVGGIGDGDDEI